jgi:hypothetical protein
MPAPISHLYVVFGGGYSDAALAAEKWQCGVRVAIGHGSIPDVIYPAYDYDAVPGNYTGNSTNMTSTANFLAEGGINDVDPANLAVDFGEAWRTFHTAAGSKIQAGCSFTGLTIYPIGSDGKVVQTAWGVAKATATPKAAVLGGGGTGTAMPVECSVVASLRTVNSTGKGRGRIFLPQMAGTLTGSGGNVTPTNQGTIADNIVTLLHAMTHTTVDIGEPTWTPIITGSPWAVQYRLKSVQIGQVVDVQRRRRRKVLEAYVSRTL